MVATGPAECSQVGSVLQRPGAWCWIEPGTTPTDCRDSWSYSKDRRLAGWGCFLLIVRLELRRLVVSRVRNHGGPSGRLGLGFRVNAWAVGDGGTIVPFGTALRWSVVS